MDMEVIKEYVDLKAEVRELENRIENLEREINNLSIVSDSVKGTRKDGTIGSIRITGYPIPEYCSKERLLKARRGFLKGKQRELEKLTLKVEQDIAAIEKSEIRNMFRLFYIDGLTWNQVAHRMNSLYPKHKKGYTEESCRKKCKRYLKK